MERSTRLTVGQLDGIKDEMKDWRTIHHVWTDHDRKSLILSSKYEVIHINGMCVSLYSATSGGNLARVNLTTRYFTFSCIASTYMLIFFWPFTRLKRALLILHTFFFFLLPFFYLSLYLFFFLIQQVSAGVKKLDGKSSAGEKRGKLTFKGISYPVQTNGTIADLWQRYLIARSFLFHFH